MHLPSICSSAPITIGPRQIMAVSASTMNPMDMALRPQASSGTSLPSSMLGFLCKPSMRGRLGPVDVGIEQADAKPAPGEGDGEVDGRGALADAAFARRDGDDARHLGQQVRALGGLGGWCGGWCRGAVGGEDHGGIDHAGLPGEQVFGGLAHTLHGGSLVAVRPQGELDQAVPDLEAIDGRWEGFAPRQAESGESRRQCFFGQPSHQPVPLSLVKRQGPVNMRRTLARHMDRGGPAANWSTSPLMSWNSGGGPNPWGTPGEGNQNPRPGGPQNQGPKGPWGGGKPGTGGSLPDLDELIARLQDKARRFVPGGPGGRLGGGGNKRLWGLLALVVVAICWEAASTAYSPTSRVSCSDSGRSTEPRCRG